MRHICLHATLYEIISWPWSRLSRTRSPGFDGCVRGELQSGQHRSIESIFMYSLAESFMDPQTSHQGSQMSLCQLRPVSAKVFKLYAISVLLRRSYYLFNLN